MKKKKGKIIIIVAPSGTGKSTLMKRVRSDFLDLSESVSYTTRDKRPGEIDGEDYHFISKEKFESMVEEGDFIEWAMVHGECKGTSKSFVEQKLTIGEDLIFDLDVQGADSFKNYFKDEAKAIFIEPPSLSILEKRLRNRGTESEESIETRLANAKIELSRKDDYDYKILNDVIDNAYNELRDLIIKLRSL